MKGKIKYIPEIDGLRAVAVLPVVFFHLGYSWIPGGFLGVDIFFVISGYLITAILIKETKKPAKTYYFDFYMRRIRRIFPVFFLVIITTLAASYFFLIPEDYLELGQSALAAIGFVSNIYFYFNTGYFDAPTETMALLHTWSLAVEEQFYMIWPALILAITSFSKKSCALLVILLFTSSLLLSFFVTPINASLSFYNFPFRVFQFMLGAAIPLSLAHTHIYKINSAHLSATLQILGLSIIGYSIFTFTPEDNLPGWLAVIPSIGASIFIVGVTLPNKPKHNPINHSVVIAIGKISFSLYLWHWPIITLYKIYSHNADIEPTSAVLLLATTLALSIASYYLIEKPFRQPKWQSKAITFTATTAVTVIIFFIMLVKTEGFSNRIPVASDFSSKEIMWKWDCPNSIQIGNNSKEFCNFGVPWDTANKRIILMGESHAKHLAPLFEFVANEKSLSFLLFNSCRPVTDGENILVRHKSPNRSTKGCHKRILEALELIKNDKKISLVVLNGGWLYSPPQLYTQEIKNPTFEHRLELMKKGLNNMVQNITRLNVDVLLIGDTPNLLSPRQDCALKNDLLRTSKPDCSPLKLNTVIRKQGPTEDILSTIANEQEHTYFHSIIKNHCNQSGCPLFINNEFIYRDAGHLRRNLSLSTKSHIVDSFNLLNATDWNKYKAN